MATLQSALSQLKPIKTAADLKALLTSAKTQLNAAGMKATAAAAQKAAIEAAKSPEQKAAEAQQQAIEKAKAAEWVAADRAAAVKAELLAAQKQGDKLAQQKPGDNYLFQPAYLSDNGVTVIPARWYMAPTPSGGGGFLNHMVDAVSGGLADLDSSLGLSKNAPLIAAVGIGLLTAGAGTALGASLTNAGLLTSAAEASSAALAAGATEAAAAAAGAAATATATAVGTAITSTAVQVAQGKPLDQAIGNSLVSLATSQVINPAIASEVKSVISSPTVATAVTNMGTNIASGVLKGQSQDQIINSALTAGASSVVNTVANDVVKNIPGMTDPNIPAEVKQVALAGVVGALTTGDGTKSMINAAVSAGTKAVLDTATDMLHPNTVAAIQDAHDTAKAAVAEEPPPVVAAAETPPAEKQTSADAVQNDFNALVAAGVDPDTALSTVVEWHAPVTSMTGSDSTQTAAVDTDMATDAGLAAEPAGGLTMALGNEAVASGMSPGALGALTAVADESLLPTQQAAAYGTPDLADLTGASSNRLADVDGSLSMAQGNEAVASGMSPGALGAQAGAENLLLPTQEAAAYGTPDVAVLTGATAAADKLTKSANEAVASGMSPGSVGAAQAAEGLLTDAQLAAASGTNTAAQTVAAPKVNIPVVTGCSLRHVSGRLGCAYGSGG